MPNADSELAALRKENAALKKELEGTKTVLMLLRELPGNRERVAASPARGREKRGTKETPEMPAEPTHSPTPPVEPAAATTKRAPKVSRRVPKTDRGPASAGMLPEG